MQITLHISDYIKGDPFSSLIKYLEKFAVNKSKY